MSFKKSYYWLLYILSFILICLSSYYLSIENLTLGISLYSVTLLLSSFVIFKNLGAVSNVTFFSMILFSLIVLVSTGMYSEEITPTAINEQSYMIALALTYAFFLTNSCYWAVTNKGWKKTLSIVFIIFFLSMSTIFALSAPNFYTNFTYTYPFVAIVFGFNVFLTIKARKFLRVLGILGLFSPLLLLFLGSVFFDQAVYPVIGDEKIEIVENMEGKAVEMLGYYNERDVENFCKYCHPNLATQYEADPVITTDVRDEYGKYTEIGEVDIKRSGDYYYVQYPVIFEKSETQQYFVLLLIDTNSEIYGFYISPDRY